MRIPLEACAISLACCWLGLRGAAAAVADVQPHQAPAEDVKAPSEEATEATAAVADPDLERIRANIHQRIQAEEQKFAERKRVMQKKHEEGQRVDRKIQQKKAGAEARKQHLQEVAERKEEGAMKHLETFAATKQSQTENTAKYFEGQEAKIKAKDEKEEAAEERRAKARAAREVGDSAQQERFETRVATHEQQVKDATERAAEREEWRTMELEVEEHLVSMAQEQRKQAEQTPAPRPRRNAAPKAPLGNVSLMVEALTKVSADDRVLRQVKAYKLHRLQPQIARYVVGIKRRVGDFVNASQEAEDDRLISLLTDFVNSTNRKLGFHMGEAARFVESIQAAMPKNSREQLKPIMGLITSDAVPFDVDLFQLAHTTPDASCGAVMALMAQASPYYTNLTKSQEALNVTAYKLPMDLNAASASEAAKEVANALLELAYAETLGLREAAHEIISKVGPVLLTRFHCGFSAAAPTGGLLATGLAGLIAAMQLVF